MRTEAALFRFAQQQQGILDHMAEAVLLVEGDPATVREPLAKARWLLARRLREYQLFKHTEIFEPAMLHGTTSHRRYAKALAEQCLANGRSFEAYLKYWSGEDIVARWTDYRSAMLALVEHLRTALATEHRMVDTLLAGSERTRQLNLAMPVGNGPRL